MKRREFTTGIGAWAGLASLATLVAAPAAHAQAPQAGKDYVALPQALPTAGDGTVEVIEFFWYGCPHCNRFEPLLERWVKQLPADVSFRRVPVAFRDAFVVHQRIYYALEALGRVEDLHRKVFFAIHEQKNPLNNSESIARFMEANGVNRTEFLDAYNSFGVQTKARQAKQLGDAYRIDGVPALGIHGRFWTSGGVAGSLERSLLVADYLINVARRK